MLTSKAMEHYGRRMVGCHQRLLVPSRTFSASLSFLRDGAGADSDPSPPAPPTPAPVPATVSPRRSMIPSLMLPPDFVRNHHCRQEKGKTEVEEGDYLYCFYSLEEKKIGGVKKDDKLNSILFPWEKDLLLPHDARCVGSSHGWLAYVVPRGSSSCPLYLFKHPPLSAPDFFSPSSMIRMPPIETFPGVTGVRVRKSGGSGDGVTREYIFEDESVTSLQYMTESYITKIVLSSAPPATTNTSTTTSTTNTGTSSCMAMAILGRQQLAFCRLGDESWTSLDKFQPYPSYEDVIYSPSNRVFYALSLFAASKGSESDAYGVLDCWDLSDPLTPKRTALIKAYVCRPRNICQWEWGRWGETCSNRKAYLVEFLGKLLMVQRFQASGGPIRNHAGFSELFKYKTVKFDVFWFDSERDNWEPLKCLGDWALFLGLNHSFALPVSDYTQLRGNSIYFTDETSNIKWREDKYSCAGQDMGIFHMEDNSIEHHYPCDANIIHPPPVWVAP